jgi:hypothetical protein
MPFVPGPRAPTTQLIGVLLAKLATPLANGFIGHENSADKEQLFDIPVVETKVEVQLYSVADDFSGKAVFLVSIG